MSVVIVSLSADPPPALPIQYLPVGAAADVAEVMGGLDAYNLEQTGLPAIDPVRFFARDANGRLHGGLLGWQWDDALHLGILWVAHAARGRGIGRSIVERCEAHAAGSGARISQLSTWEFQAMGFYRTLGYAVAGSVPDYPRGHTRYLLWKRLPRSMSNRSSRAGSGR